MNDGEQAAELPMIAVVGATATGKSDLAVILAQRLNGEIINADAMQFYRGMDIGTAKLSLEERGGIDHHLLDILNVTQDASVADFQVQARRLISEIRGRGRLPILVGGSGLYVRAAIDHLSFPGTDPRTRAQLEAECAQGGPEALHARLSQVDSDAAEKISRTDSRRIVRALEVIELTGEPFSAQLPEYSSAVDAVQIGIRSDRSALHQRIEQRVVRMWDSGWTAEVQALLAHGLREGRTARRAIGYAQIIDLLDGRLSESQAVESTIIRTRQFAKRQDTWFRRDPRICWIEAAQGDPVAESLRIWAAHAHRQSDSDPHAARG